ncbi:hypothetical protein [Brachyspira pulli]|uniref:hypothetical protein n=1 Tax=Brachyspira pulli TaxID=310721 RepID=UPI0030078EE3
MIDYNKIKTILENDYKDCYDTISDISLDDRDKNNIVYLINDQNKKSINFDKKLSKKFKAETEIGNEAEFKSVDMLNIRTSNIDLIEFKNINKPTNYKDKLKIQGIESLIVLFNFLKEKQLINSFNQLFDFNFIKINYYIIVPDNLEANEYSDNNLNRNRLKKELLFNRLESEYSRKFFYDVTAYNASSFKTNYIDIYI